jgi:hypothetical protein
MTHWNLQAPWTNPVIAAELVQIMMPRAEDLRADYDNQFSSGAIESLVGHTLWRRIRPFINLMQYNHRGDHVTMDEGVQLLANELARPWLVLTTETTRFTEVSDVAVNFVKQSMNDSMCFLSNAETKNVADSVRMARTWRKRALRGTNQILYDHRRADSPLIVGHVMSYMQWNRDEDYWGNPTNPVAHVRNYFTREVT